MTHRHWMIICTVGPLLALTISAAAQAGVSERDWKTPGDGLLTYDDINQREWLDVPVTLLEQYPGSVSERYDAVTGATEPGGEFFGFSTAALADLVALAESAGVDTTSTGLSVNGDATNELISLLEPTFISVGGVKIIYGYLQEFPDAARILVATDTWAGLFSDNSGIDPAGISSTHGVWLYRDVVPEPTFMTLLLAVAGFSLGVVRRQNLGGKP